ncbi:thyroglobulin [Rhinophrynus dorsalis]
MKLLILHLWKTVVSSSSFPQKYQLDSQPLRPCELARERAHVNGEGYIPQCTSEGLYRNIQCSRNGLTCWCVDGSGTEVPGSRQTGSPAVCLSFCQLTKQQILVSGYINRTSTSNIPQCRYSGEFEPVQCNQEVGQCWCVDSEGMEIYGTRQTGKPTRCPQSCEIRDRRILHGVGEKVPPHCSEDGEFSPVQCKLVNTTDKMVFDVVTSFSRFPETFKSFSSLRESFPELSGYCYCADSLGRELAGTGLELLLDEIYDTVFAGLSPTRTFTGTAAYRILQRRFLGVQLITSGKFRCPSTCEVQRFTASQQGDIYIPSCDDNGDFSSVQCQTGGQCWCVDSKGREIYGSRTIGDSPNCNDPDCSSKRRQALSRLFYGPAGYFGKNSLFYTQEEELGAKISNRFCSSYIVETFMKSGLLLPITEKTKDKKLRLDYFISDMVSGLFPSKDLIQVALKFTSNPKRFQQNLFGGKYLKNMGAFNFTGAVGARSKFNFSDFFQQIGLTGMYSGGNFRELAKLFSSEEDSYLTKESFNISKPIFNLNQAIQSSFGRIVNLQENQNLVDMFASILELEEFSAFLKAVISVPKYIARDVSEAVKIIVQSKECENRNSDIFVPRCSKEGRYEDIQCSQSECWCVDGEGREIPRSRTQGKNPRCPTKCEKERERQTIMRKSQPAGSELFIPTCDIKGDFMTVECAGKNCFCADIEGRKIPGTQKLSGESIKCPSNCQLTAGDAFLQTVTLLLSEPLEISQPLSVYIPQCTDNGEWRPVQCNGPTEQAFEFFDMWTKQNKDMSLSETLNVLLMYKNTSSQSFSTFVRELYSNGHHHVFPVFSKYSVFSDVPTDVLDGNITTLSDNVLLNPYVVWRLLNGSVTHYPGSYRDFSVPLSHFELRNCWCVDVDGQRLQGTEVQPNKVPKCPGTCELTKQRAVDFINEAEELIAASNTSHFPLGQSFLTANGIRLTESDLFHPDGFFKSGITFSERFLSQDAYVLQLAAQSTLHFYWQRGFASRRSFGDTAQVEYLPYVPQCDGLGNWNPVQFYESTGHYWCVDENGNYIAGSLVNRTSHPPQCPGFCASLKSEVSARNIGTGYIPTCGENETLSPVQCDQDGNVCHCVFPGGEEASGTRVIVSDMGRPTCNSPVCPFSFSEESVKHGAVFCEEMLENGESVQKCKVVCRNGYYNVLSTGEMYICDPKTRRWGSQSPHPQACQKIQSFQTVQTQAYFQLLLPASKKCMADYSGLLQAFRTFIMDDLKARGLCHIQVDYFGSSGKGAVPVCDDSTVYVECASTDRLRVNVTWTALLEDIPHSTFPALHDIENAFVGENLAGRFLAIVTSGTYSLTVESNQFLADESVFFPNNGDLSASPRVNLGCADGFQKLTNAKADTGKLGGCGFTDCQLNDIGLLCDNNGQYVPSQKDLTTNKYFCVDNAGERLEWTATDAELTNEQCTLLRKFELVPENKLIFSDENPRSTQMIESSGQRPLFLDCIMDCAKEELCDYVAVSINGSQVICDQYNGDVSNVICNSTKQVDGALGNSASRTIEKLSCQFKIKESGIKGLAVYQKKGQEFPRTGLKLFEKSDFGNTLSGVYRTLVLSAEGATLSDSHTYCRQTCAQDSCCDGFILSQIILNKGTILCGLLSSPNVLLCNVNDWSETSSLGSDGVCKGVKSNKEKKMFSFFLGGQEFTGSYSLLSMSIGKVEYSTQLSDEVKEEIQQRFIRFQRVFLKRGSDNSTMSSACSPGPVQGQTDAVSDSAMDRFLLMDANTVTTDQERFVSSQQYGISKQRYSSSQALLWCLTRCLEEETWCRLSDLQDSSKEYFTCIIYPDAWKCNVSDLVPDNCEITLHKKPQLLYHRKEILGNTVKHFYTLLPYQKITGLSVRNKIVITGKTISNGFFECELQCDADPCCKGFGYLQRPQGSGMELLCLTAGSLGIQSCPYRSSDPFHVVNCSSLNEGIGTHPFGWFQKPVISDDWIRLDNYSVMVDSSLSAFDTVRISRDSPDTLSAAQKYCLSECSKVPSCVTTTIEVQKSSIRCLFYPETQKCDYSLKSHHCQLLVKEPTTYIFRKKASTQPKTSVTIPSHGTLLGKSQSILIGSNAKKVKQFLGIPYASPPVGENRFRAPQPFIWTGTWNATTSRASCLQPGDGKAQYSSVSEDCLYLNVFLPQNAAMNTAVLLYFHNSPSDYSENGQTFIDGSYQAAIGDTVVVTASYRVGVFGFLSTGNTVPSGNWGLLDQAAALKWVQENIAYFGGDPGMISIAADGAGADVASMHLLVSETQAFRRALLMGGSAFSPLLVISEKRAQEQVDFLAKEVGCQSPSNEDVLSCLRNMDAGALNAAQTKLLALRGPFQTWGPVVDQFYVKETPSKLLQKETLQNIDLLIGSTEQDGLISRAKAIKRFEESQGRGDSKMAFYQALQNSLGGEEGNPFVQDAAVWFYSLQHSSDEYSVFSRALENSTRDHFITCPAVRMAKHWSKNSKGNVFMYHVPDTFSQSSFGLDLPEDVIYAFGLPFHENYKNQFSSEEQSLSLKIMQYVANFVKTGNPNFQYTFSRKISRSLLAWPMYLAHKNGENYKELSKSLSNKQGLKRGECSFWNDYIPALKVSTGIKGGILRTQKSLGTGLVSTASPALPKQDKEAYN